MLEHIQHAKRDKFSYGGYVNNRVGIVVVYFILAPWILTLEMRIINFSIYRMDTIIGGNFLYKKF